MKRFSHYLAAVAQVNGLGNGTRPPQKSIDWLFYPGMLQDSRSKWWADFGIRHAVHEGIDICFYKTQGIVSALEPGARVPALAKGTLLNISQDLLGQTMAVSFAPASTGGYTPILVYSHLKPDPGLGPGDPILEGQIIGQTFDARLKKSRLLSHLHISCILIPPPVDTGRLNWSLFANRDKVTYVNPIFL